MIVIRLVIVIAALLNVQAVFESNFLSCRSQLNTTFPSIWRDASQQQLKLENVRSILEVSNGIKDFVHMKGAFAANNLPSSFYPEQKFICTSEHFLLKISQITESLPVAYRVENNGTLIPDMIPQYKMASTQSGLGNVDLRSHTDNGFLPDGLSPVFMGLAGNRMNENAYTLMYPVDAIMEILDKDSINQLKSPIFNLTSPESFRFQKTSYSHLLHSPLIPLLYQCLHLEDKWCMRIGTSVRATTEAGSVALNKLYDVIPSTEVRILIEPGDVLLFDNHRVLHGRSEFTPNYDGQDRWIQKLYMSPRKLLRKYGFGDQNVNQIVFETEQFLPFLSSELYSADSRK